MNDLQHAVAQLVPSVASVRRVCDVGGGCISHATRVTVSDAAGKQSDLFVKSNDEDFLSNFRAEWDGLMRLAEVDVIGVPRPLAVGNADGKSWLVTEWIQQGSRGAGFFQIFGEALAQLHKVTLGDAIGLDQDNFLGAAPQINSAADDWPTFFATHRIGYQTRWAVDQGLADPSLVRDCEQIAATMDVRLEGRDEQTSLLHGDLWSGNYLCDAGGQAVIIDPAVYYGCREAEFGMLRLFGSCPESFYDAYAATIPLPDGWRRRVSVYVLYHLLNHLNLFGRGYHGQCQSLAAEILRA